MGSANRKGKNVTKEKQGKQMHQLYRMFLIKYQRRSHHKETSQTRKKKVQQEAQVKTETPNIIRKTACNQIRSEQGRLTLQALAQREEAKTMMEQCTYAEEPKPVDCILNHPPGF